MFDFRFSWSKSSVLMARPVKVTPLQTKLLRSLLVVLLASACQQTLAASYRLPGGELINDPTAPTAYKSASAKKAPAPTFKLSYVLASAERKYAIINGKKVEEGDTVSGARVIAIGQHYVEILSGGAPKRLSLNSVKGIQRKP